MRTQWRAVQKTRAWNRQTNWTASDAWGTVPGMTKRKVTQELWAALEPLIPKFVPTRKGSGPAWSMISLR